ncbi:MAG: hypothetical protein ACC645_01640 [Pirellulales bacterium]
MATSSESRWSSCRAKGERDGGTKPQPVTKQAEPTTAIGDQRNDA